nr:hypothetical protein [Tanacetum cinerariifolium]
MLSSFLLSQEFSKGSVDPILFIRKNDNDLLLISQNPIGIFINQSKYSLESLKKYGFESCELVDTPMVEKSKLDEDKEGKAVDPSHYREEILEFLRFLGHSTQIKTLTDVNKPSIPRRNRVNWHYVRDDVLFTTIKVVSRHQNTQQYGVILPNDLTNDNIRNNKAYKEYYACATGEAAPKPKASARKKTSGSTSSTTPPTPIATSTPTTIVVAALRLSAAAKGKQPARATTPTEPTDVERTEAEQLKIVLKQSRQETHISQQRGSGTDEGTGSRPGVSDVPSDDSKEELSWNSSDDEDVAESDDEATESDRENDEDDDNNEEDQDLRIGEQERMQEEDDAEELYRDVDINQGRGLQVSQETEDTHVILTLTQSYAQQESSSTSSFMTNLLNPITDPATQLPTPPTQIPSLDLQSLPTFVTLFCFQDRVKSLEDNFSNIPGIEAVNAQLEAKVLTISSHSSRTSYAVAADLSEMELKKILIEKMEGNMSIQRSDEQQNLYKALVEAYDADKTILDTYGESTILKQRQEDDDQEGPSAGSDRVSKRPREGGEHASASTLSAPTTGSAGRSTTGSQSRQLSASESAFAEEPVQPTCQMEEPLHLVFETSADDQPIIQTTQHPEWFSQPRRPLTADQN